MNSRTVIFLLAGLHASTCFAYKAECPEKIYTQQRLATAAPGWREFERDPAGTAGSPPSAALRSGFSHIEVYDGEPKELADLVPDNERDTWTFEAPRHRERPLFVACVYDGTYVRFVRQLPDGVTKCRASERVLRCDEMRRGR